MDYASGLRAFRSHAACVVLGLTCLLSAWPSLAADPPTVTIPKLTKPLVEAVEGDALQTDYDKMWEDYEATLNKARDGIVTALDKQIAKATEDGDLDQVEHWEGVRKQFAAAGTLSWDTSSKAVAEWKKTNPKVPFPREFNDAVRSAISGADSAREKLDEGYASLVKAYTKAKNVARAKDLREEQKAATEDTPRESVRSSTSPLTRKEHTKAAGQKPLTYRFASEADIRKDWDFVGDSWRIENGALLMSGGSGVRTHRQYQGDFAVRVLFQGHVYVKACGEEFLQFPPETSVVLERRGGQLLVRTGSGNLKTVELKKSQMGPTTVEVTDERANPGSSSLMAIELVGTLEEQTP